MNRAISARQKREARIVGSHIFRAFLESISPARGFSFGEQRINWKIAKNYFEGMADPYKSFEFTFPGPDGKSVTVSKSTAELMKIQQSGYAQAQNELSRILSDLESQGIISGNNQLPENAPEHIRNPSSLLSEYPFTNDVYFPDPLRKIEGMAIPRGLSPMYLTPKAFDAGLVPSRVISEAIVSIYTAVAALHRSANANVSLSPAVSIATTRLGSTANMFNTLDNAARSPLVPKSARVPEMELLRGCWADNKYYGDVGSDRSLVYSNKNVYLPGLGEMNSTRVPDIYRTGDGNQRIYVNPMFPEYLRPIHAISLPQPGMRADSGLVVAGQSDYRWVKSLESRSQLWSLQSVCQLTPGRDNWIQAAGFNQPFTSDLSVRGADMHLAYFKGYMSRSGSLESVDADSVIRRLRDWYYANKSSCEVTVSDAMTDFACAVQLARFMAVVPPHVLLHSVMGYHNALLKLSFEYVGVPFSTAITDYQLKMRLEREGIAGLAARDGMMGTGDTGLGYALTVKSPDSVVMADAGLSATTVASLSIAASLAAANPVAGLVCLALVGCAVLIAELEGGYAQALITPRDRSKEELRDTRNKGLRCNMFRAYTPEFVVNSVPVLRV